MNPFTRHLRDRGFRRLALLVFGLPFLALSQSSCVATAGDLRDLNAQFAESVERLTSEFDDALEDQEKALEAVQTAQATGASQEELDELKREYQDSLTGTVSRAEEAVSVAASEVADAVEAKIEEISDRVEAIGEQGAVILDKAAEGPSGWLELALALIGTGTATGFGVNMARNASRKKALEEQEAKVVPKAAQEAEVKATQLAAAVAREIAAGVLLQQQSGSQAPYPPPQPPNPQPPNFEPAFPGRQT